MVCQVSKGVQSLQRLGVLVVGLSLLLSSPVWSGFACLEDPCFHGICIDYLHINSSHQCYCRNGFTGYSCQINWDECRSNPCLNGGTCTDGIASFNCSCPDNFAGRLCEWDLSACDDLFPCQNNGTCSLDPNSPNGTLACLCPPGFSGGQCENDVSVCNLTENVCRNGGVCVDGLGPTFACQCQPGWSGKTCEVEVDECQSQPCHNGGICVDKVNDFSCACHFGYTGKACESKLKICAENPCANGAFCLQEDVDDAQPTCYCVPDFHGTLCELKYDDCDPPPKCFNGGTCVDGVGDFSCSCPPPHFGPTCQCAPLNTSHPECNLTSSPTPPSELELSRSLESFFQLSTSLLPSSVLPNAHDLTSSPLHTSSLLLQSQPVLHSPWSSSMGGSSEPVTPTASDSSGELPLLPTATLTATLQGESEVVAASPPPPLLQSQHLHLSSASLFLSLPPEGSSPLPSDLLSPSPQASPPVLTIISDFHTATLPVLTISEVTFPSASLEGSSLLLSEGPPEGSSAVRSDLLSPSPEASPILPVLTITEVAFPSASVVLEGSSLLFNESLLSSSYETELPHRDILTRLPPSPSAGAFDSEVISSAHEASAAIVSSSIEPSVSPVVVVSSEMSESLWMTSDLLSPSLTTRGHVVTPTLLEASPSAPIEETLSFHLRSSKDESLPSASLWEDSSSATWNASSWEGDEESGVVSSPTESLHSASRLPHLSLTPPLVPSTSLPPHTILPTPSLPPVSSPTASLPPTSAPPTDLCADFCLNGATCVATSIRPECLCTFKFTGERCETRRTPFRRVSFSGDSFIGYRVPNESVNRIEVAATVATNFPEGILLYTSVGTLYALLFLQDGHLTLHFSCGQQSMHFTETRTTVHNGANFTLAFQLELVVGAGGGDLSCVAQVSVNHTFVMRGQQTLSLNGPPEAPVQSVFLGGVPASSNAIRNDELIGIMAGLRGCLYTLSINQEEKDLFEDAVEAQGVSECSAFECAGNPCVGYAKCVPFDEYPFWTCLCPPGFVGVRCQIRVCESENSCQNGATCTYAGQVEGPSPNRTSHAPPSALACLCPLGFGGRHCHSPLNLTKPSFRPTFAFDYSAFIAYAPIPRFVEWVQLKFHFVTPNVSQVALLVYSGFSPSAPPSLHPEDLHENYADLSKDPTLPQEEEDGFDFQPDSSAGGGRRIVDFFALTFVHGYITLTWNLGSGTQRIITPGRIDRRLNIHTLFAGRSGRVAWLKVDGMRNVSGKSPGPFHRLNANSELFVGGHEAFRFEGLPHDLPLHKGFHGCIFDFGFRVKNRLYLPRATRGRNVQNCYEEDC